jgi:DNA-binding CsgD family transcriptional regulator
MLLGRSDEQRQIGRLLLRARRGRSGALLLLGEPGIGKTALLEHAENRAGGWIRLRGTGAEPEAELPFAALSQLLTPVLDQLPAIPPLQAGALSAALALGPAQLGDRFTVFAAVLSLIAAAAERRPVLVVLDDAHWFDHSSQQALLFAIRRLHAERIAVLVAARSGADHSFLDSGLAQLRLGGLAHDAAGSLVGRAAGVPVASDVADCLVEATGGNPLALLHVPRQLSPLQLAGQLPLPDPLPVGESLRSLFLSRLRRLPSSTMRALLLASAADPAPLSHVASALSALELPPSVLEPAEAEGIVSIVDGQIHFSHPLIRASVYHHATPAERRHAHRLIAAQLTDPQQRSQRAWHLAAGALAPHEEVAAELEAAAAIARSRGAHAAAGQALERSAALTTTATEQSRRLIGAASEFHVAGNPDRALALLDHRAHANANAELQAQRDHLRGRVLLWRGPVDEGIDVLVQSAGEIGADDPDTAIALLVDAAVGCFMSANILRAAEVARKAYGLADRASDISRARAALVLGGALLATGESRQARELLATWRPLLAGIEPPIGLLQLAGQLPLAAFLMWNEEHDLVREILDGAIAFGRSIHSPAMLPFFLAIRSDLSLRTGAWNGTLADADECVRLAQETGQPALVAYGLGCLARAEALMGRESARETASSALEIGGRSGGHSIRVYVGAALGSASLGAQRFAEAADHLMRAWTFMHDLGMHEVTPVPYAADLAEALLRSNRREEADAVTGFLDRRAKESGLAWTNAVAARCRALLAPDNGCEADFAEALEWHDRLRMPYERARTQLLYGERLRRIGQRARARGQLREALAEFELLGAAPWAAQAGRLLRATGETVIPRRPGGISELTPQELQVALAVASGASNREAAAALFLSPKTVEFHLTRVYSKLEVRSRTELARAL